MISVLIVDDEPIMCRGLSNAIPWEHHGFSVIGCCYDGEEALDKIRQLQPDIVITDIRMPVLDGLELSKLVHNEFVRTKVLILSGYDEFNYAKQAIRHGVFEYLLKPIDNSELLNTLLKVKDSIESENEQQRRKKETEERLNSSLPLIKAKALENIVNGNVRTIDEFNSIVSLLGLKLRKTSYIIQAFYVYDTGQAAGDSKNITGAAGIIGQILAQYDTGEFWIEDGNRINVILSLEDECYAIALNIGEEILFNVKKFLEIDIAGSISGQYASRLDIPKAYREASKLLKCKIFSGDSRLIKAEDRFLSYHDNHLNLTNLENDLLFHIRYGDRDKARQALSKLQDAICGHSCSPEFLEDKLREIVILVIKTARENGVNPIKNTGFNIYGEFMYNFKDLEEINSWFISFVEDMAESIAAIMRKKYSGVVGKVISFIEQHYKDDITLSSIAGKVYMNSNYLSQLFKQQTGRNFLEYLTEFRIAKAKELLKSTNIKAYDVAGEVGYRDHHYFSQIFKKYTGLSPAEFRKR